MNDAPQAFIATLGCPKNEVDSKRMAEQLSAAGYVLVDELACADIAFVNTCSFIRAATEESIDAVLDVLDDSTVVERNVPVVVCGCMPARYGDELAKAMSDVAAFLPCDAEDSVVEVADACLKRISSSVTQRDKESSRHATNLEKPPQHDEGAVFAYVKISEGCSRCCAYCTIPMIRGPYRSYPLEEIEHNVANLVERGIREIVLIGQDTGLWGSDFTEPQTLAFLLRHLSQRFPETWFRIMYTQPESVTDELLDVLSQQENVCSYLDIPLQHCSEQVLARMGRAGSRASIEALLARARKRVSDLTLRTTLMCGFPGETDDDFDELVSFVSDAGFDYVGVFAFSPEEGTRAARMDGQLDDEERQWRAERLRTIADALSGQVVATRIGQTCNILVEGIEEDGQRFGRTMQQAPEVDGVTFLDRGEVGTVVSATVEDTLIYDMEASVHGA